MTGCLFKEAGLGEELPPEGYIWVDSGFQGIQKDYPGLQVVMPRKKPRGEKLTLGQKEINQVIAKGRVFVEPVLAGVKRLKVVSEVYGNRRVSTEDRFMVIACGLWNYPVQAAA